MKLFKNFKTKQQLREEIAELKGMLYPQKPQIHIAEREVQKVSSDMVFDDNESVERIKERIAYGMVEFLKPLIEWNITDDKSNPFKKTNTRKYLFSKEKIAMNRRFQEKRRVKFYEI